MSAELINIERKYKGIKYEIKGCIKYGTPCGSYIGINNKIYLNDNLFRLYKKYPLQYLRVNHVLGYKVRPCTTKVIVTDYDDKDIEGNEYKYDILRYIVNIDEEDKYLRIETYDSVHMSDAYIVEKIVMEVIDYLAKLKNKKGK